jgi:flagellar export protein FliJ
MAFHFQLDVILRLRRGQERVERLKLESIASEQAHAKRQLEIMTEQFLESRRRFQEQMGVEKFGSELQFEDARSGRITTELRTLKMRIAELEQERLQQVEVYTKARQSREILENLRSRKFAVYSQIVSRREQQELDDLFLMRQDFRSDE